MYLAVDEATRECTDDDRLLVDALDDFGARVEPLVWGGDVPDTGTVVIRSTWDYVERPAQFAAWLDALEASDVVVHNPVHVLRWNMTKRYLPELAERGVPAVPTRLVPAGTRVDLQAVGAALGWSDLVVKPAVGGGGRLATTSRHVDADALQQHLDAIVATEDAIVQPYVDDVSTHGEISVVAVAGEPLLAVEKRAAAGDWRVHAEYGGTAHAVPLTPQLVEIATTALRTVDVVPAYARIDVTGNPARHQVLELELVEPELFFRLDPSVATRLARHLVPG